MSDDDIPAEQTDDSPTTDAAETAVDGGAVATEAPQSRFWGVVPSGWELVEGSEVYDVNPSYTPEEEEVTYIEMDALDTELPFPKYSKKRKAADYSGKLFGEGDTLFARITPCTENGKTAFVNEMDTEVGIGSTEYAVLSPDRERIHPLYLYYVAKSHPVRNYAISRMRGSTGRQRVPFDVFRKELDIALPPLQEQRRSASVLYNIDSLIQKTNSVIEQLERVRRGTEQEVLSRGVLEDGSLRDYSDTKSEKWIGKVPADWEVRPYGEVLDDSSVGIVVKPSQYYDDSGSVPILRSKDISRDGIQNGDFEYMTEESNEENANSRLSAGDVITVRSGDPGLSCVVTSEYEGANCADLLITTPGDEIDPQFAAMWINSRAGRKQIDRFQAGLAQQHFNLGDLRKLQIAVPSLEEQQRIVQKVASLTRSIEVEEQYLDKIKRVKRGLLQDLLTGDSRTNVPELDVLEQVKLHG
ncbi:restriction endonuclease subunit S [Natrinema altunense]|uniref:Restriction endonuclease subunit S n=1 Tax=Natrinema altunense TaxID=222984 RepID=A0A482Y2Z4_9EURY|nr:restriction endonuclease subunit S [Natrinema altunense]RZH68763.1 restriction endonuclease subunit S [Natrinema altunense]